MDQQNPDSSFTGGGGLWCVWGVKMSLDFPSRENGYETFKASVFIPRKMQARFLLHYEELLQRRLGKYEYTVSIRPQQLVGRLRVEVNILENSGIISLEVPPLRNSKHKGSGKVEGKERFYDSWLWFCYSLIFNYFSRTGLAVLGSKVTLDNCAEWCFIHFSSASNETLTKPQYHIKAALSRSKTVLETTGHTSWRQQEK